MKTKINDAIFDFQELQQSAIFSSDQWIAKDLNKLLSEMPISEFKLVADSVDAFEKLIESMKSDDGEIEAIVDVCIY